MSRVENFQDRNRRRQQLLMNLSGKGVIDVTFELYEAGYELTEVPDLGGSQWQGVQLVYKKKSSGDNSYYRGELICISFRESHGRINMSIHSSELPVKAYFPTNGDLSADMLGGINMSIRRAVESPGKYEWFENSFGESYRYQ